MRLYPVQNVFILCRVFYLSMGEFLLYGGLMCVVWDLFFFFVSHTPAESVVSAGVFETGGKSVENLGIFHGFCGVKQSKTWVLGCFTGGMCV